MKYRFPDAVASSFLLAAALAACSAAHAQLLISPAHKLSWSENTGWFNWRDAAFGTQAVRLHAAHLTGRIWSSNTGWIDVGSGPANGVSYANAGASTFGVNHDPSSGTLTGFAWAENVGWLNFGAGALASPPNPACINPTIPRRLSGFAWSENLGWINLGDASVFLEFDTCPADLNADGIVDDSDFVLFASAYDKLDCADLAMPKGCPADLNADEFVDDADFSGFVVAYNEFLCP